MALKYSLRALVKSQIMVVDAVLRQAGIGQKRKSVVANLVEKYLDIDEHRIERHFSPLLISVQI